MPVELQGPGRRWYLVALGLVIAAAAIASIATAMSISSIQFTHVQLPGSVPIEVTEEGEWVICIESHDGSQPVAPSMDIEFINSQSGQVLPMLQTTWPLKYQMGDARGVAVGSVNLGRKGEWVIKGHLVESGDHGSSSWQYAVGPQPVSGVFAIMLVGGGLSVIAFSLGVGICGLVFWMRWKIRAAV